MQSRAPNRKAGGQAGPIVIAGAGMVGLGAALALANGKRDIILLERDHPPPAIAPHQSFELWQRRGVAQLRHSHIFLGRLMALLRERSEPLLEELLAAGARLFSFEQALPPSLRATYVAQPGDENLALLYCRRTTLEFVMRRHVERLPGVRVLHDAKVHGLIAGKEGELLKAEGVAFEHGGRCEEILAGIVIDATGRGSHFPRWLKEKGVVVGEEKSPAGILYYTRHYRLKDAAEEPAFDGSPTAGDLGYLKYGVCPADNRRFSITLAVPEVERDLRHAISQAASFDAVCAALPGCARWMNGTRAEAVSPVYAMGNLSSVWRTFLKDGKPQILDFFAIGDAAIRSNPLYGRGCSAGILHAFILRSVLEEIGDPAARATALESRMHDVFRAHFDSMVRQDFHAIRRAQATMAVAGKMGLKARLRKSLVEEGLVPAMQGDLDLVRASARAFHMIDPPIAWRKHPGLFARVLRMWARPSSEKRAHGLYPAPLGPKRHEMLARVGLA